MPSHSGSIETGLRIPLRELGFYQSHSCNSLPNRGTWTIPPQLPGLSYRQNTSRSGTRSRLILCGDQNPMKTASRNLLTALLLTSVMAMPIRAQAVMFTWTRLLSGSASGSWGTQSFWTGGVLPTSTSDGANFSTLDVSTDSTVSLDGNRAINSLSFGDTNATQPQTGFWHPAPRHPQR